MSDAFVNCVFDPQLVSPQFGLINKDTHPQAFDTTEYGIRCNIPMDSLNFATPESRRKTKDMIEECLFKMAANLQDEKNPVEQSFLVMTPALARRADLIALQARHDEALERLKAYHLTDFLATLPIID